MYHKRSSTPDSSLKKNKIVVESSSSRRVVAAAILADVREVKFRVPYDLAHNLFRLSFLPFIRSRKKLCCAEHSSNCVVRVTSKN
jgi:hypothetical protein